jgi:Histidine kinase-, DNA gyrase B-, and HSP90-like ATPase
VTVVAFRTRARTIDHLGRGQIADCPTAVSELWKNAYDAYATSVVLHIFDGKTPISAVTDNGHGMDYEEFLAKWLIVGTDAKVAGSVTPKDDRNGLPVRERQGEKGIGRLSVAFLGPVVLVLSKRKNKPFVSALVDWRLFENPFLLLGDIQVPVRHFDEKAELEKQLPEMFAELGANIDHPVDDEAEEEENERAERLTSAWERYSAIQKKEKLPTTASAIKATAESAETFAADLTGRCLSQWSVWNGKATHGTALFILHANHEIAVWVDPEAIEGDPEADAIKARNADRVRRSLHRDPRRFLLRRHCPHRYRTEGRGVIRGRFFMGRTTHPRTSRRRASGRERGIQGEGQGVRARPRRGYAVADRQAHPHQGAGDRRAVRNLRRHVRGD